MAPEPPSWLSEYRFIHRRETDRQIMDRSHEVSLDIDEIATSLRGQMKTNKVFSSKCCIYRVPETLRELNEKAYAPRVVSIGPIHHGKENLEAMEDHKIMYLHQFLERSKLSVEELINVVKDNETALRDCYAETTIDLSREDFATIILLDTVFIIMVLLKLNYVGEFDESGSGDHIFFRPWKLFDVMWDMCLLENQLPFFILEKLFELSTVAINPKKSTVIELTSLLLRNIMEEWVKEDSWKTINSSEVLHFVDFIRKCQQPTERSSEERETANSSAPTATERSSEERETAISSAPTATNAPTATERSSEEGETANSSAPTATERSSEERETAISSAPTATERSREERETAILSAPTATELHQSGVKFKKSGSKLLLDVRFSDGILEIPQLRIHARTETLFRNLQAFEQCHYLSENRFVSDYITFISCLVRAPNDVEVLVQNESWRNLLSSDEAVSSLINKIRKENYVRTDGFLIGICEELTLHCRKRRHKWNATLKQVYFNNPWTVISFAAAAFLLVLTVIQTVCSILQVI